MRAAIFNGPGSIEVGERPDPRIEHPTDAVVRVVMACVCGSDLWYYRGESEHAVGSIGHEFIGVVDEIGADVTAVAVGDLVVAPFIFSDMTCPHCGVDAALECVGTDQSIDTALAIARPGSTIGFVTMWVVRVGDDLYVRSAGGPDRAWYRRAIASGRGTIRAGGVERDVTFANVETADGEAIDAAYHAKYDRYGPEIVGSVVGPAAHGVTIRLVPAPTIAMP